MTPLNNCKALIIIIGNSPTIFALWQMNYSLLAITIVILLSSIILLLTINYSLKQYGKQLLDSTLK